MLIYLSWCQHLETISVFLFNNLPVLKSGIASFYSSMHFKDIMVNRTFGVNVSYLNLFDNSA